MKIGLSLPGATLGLALCCAAFGADSPGTASIKESPLRLPATGKSGFALLPPSQTGITITNSLDEWASAENRVLNNGSGVAAGDFDNDGLPDLFFSTLNNQNRLYKNLGNFRFADVTAQAGLTFAPGYYRAAVFADVNGDGSLDLLVGMVGKGVLCFLNDGHGHFTNATLQAGTASKYATESLALADVDGNGTLDLYVANNRTEDIRDWIRIPVMLVNKKPTVPPQLQDRLTFENGQVQEYGEPDSFYLNDGKGHFEPVSWTAGKFLDEQGKPLERTPRDWGLTPAFRDLNGDGLPDLYVCNDYWTADRIWINTGQGVFRAIEQQAIRKISASSMGVAFSDVNQDGYLDIFVVDMLSRTSALRKRQLIAKRAIAPRIGDTESRVQTPQNTLLLNRGDGTYAEIACLAGLEASEWSWSPLFLDVDLDGFDDLLISAGHIRDIQDLDATEKIKSLQDSWRRQAASKDVQRAFVQAKYEHTKLYPPLEMPVIAFHNSGQLRFDESTEAWGLNHAGVNHGMAVADLDGDGDLDVIVNRLGQPPAIYRNESIAPRIAVRLRGRAPNTQAIGAHVELTGGAVGRQQREVMCGGNYLSGSDTLIVFAAGMNQSGFNLQVTWPDGTLTTTGTLQPNRSYEITQLEPRPSNIRNNEGSSSKAWFEDVSSSIGHSHQETPFDDFQRQPLLPRKLSQNGPGIAWFDVNGDGWDDLIIGSGSGAQVALFLNKAGKGFERLTDTVIDRVAEREAASLIALHTPRAAGQSASGVSLLVAQSGYRDANMDFPSVRQFEFGNRALESSNFPSHKASVGPMAVTELSGQLWLFVGGQVIPGRYPESASSLVFQWANAQWKLDPTNSATLANVGLVNGAVWSDLDNDGAAELIVACEWGPIRIYRLRNGRLAEITEALGMSRFTGLWNGITVGDFDEDGRMDIIAGNWGLNSRQKASPDRPLTLVYGEWMGSGGVDLLQTEWDRGRLVPALQRDALGLPFVLANFASHLAYSESSVEQALGDRINHSQKVTATTLATTLFLNRGDHFEAHELPLEAQVAPVFGIQVADVDGDGHDDVFLSQNFFAFRREEDRCEAGRGLWLRGDGHGKLIAVPGNVSGVKCYGEQRGAAVADFDHDGRVDLAVTQNGSATRLFHNVAGKPGLRVKLVGPDSNPDGFGALLRLRYGTESGPAREVHGGSGYWSEESPIQVLGLTQTPTELSVRWPGGKVSQIQVTAGMREVTVRYHETGEGLP